MSVSEGLGGGSSRADLSAADRRLLLDELPEEVARVLGDVVPTSSWLRVLELVSRMYPSNTVINSLSLAYGIGAARPDMPAQPPNSRAERCHLIVGINILETDETGDYDNRRREIARVLTDLGLEPVEQWNTDRAVSYQLNTDDVEELRRLIEQEDLLQATAIVAPGQSDTLIRQSFVQGPDNRQFRLNDIPASQRVSDIADALRDEYEPDADQTQPREAVVDRVDSDGQGQRLTPDETLFTTSNAPSSRYRISLDVGPAASPAELGRLLLDLQVLVSLAAGWEGSDSEHSVAEPYIESFTYRNPAELIVACGGTLVALLGVAQVWRTATSDRLAEHPRREAEAKKLLAEAELAVADADLKTAQALKIKAETTTAELAADREKATVEVLAILEERLLNFGSDHSPEQLQAWIRSDAANVLGALAGLSRYSIEIGELPNEGPTETPA